MELHWVLSALKIFAFLKIQYCIQNCGTDSLLHCQYLQPVKWERHSITVQQLLLQRILLYCTQLQIGVISNNKKLQLPLPPIMHPVCVIRLSILDQFQGLVLSHSIPPLNENSTSYF